MNVEVARRASMVAGGTAAVGSMVVAGLAIDGPTDDSVANGLLIGGGTTLAVGGAMTFIAHGASGATAGLEALRYGGGTAAALGFLGGIFGFFGAAANS